MKMTYYTTAEAAKYCGLSLASMHYHRKCGRLVPSGRYGYMNVYSQEYLDAFLRTKPGPGWVKGRSRKK